MSRIVSRNSNLIGDNNNNSGNIVNSYNISIFDEKRQVLEWPSPLTSCGRHQAVRDARTDGVGDWLLRTKDFSTWRRSEDGAGKPVLLCHGDPGVGKTYISSLVIDTLSDATGSRNATVAYVYCDYSAQDMQSAKTVLASVLRQVVGALARIPDEVRQAFERANTQVDGCGPRLPEILEMLIASLSRLQKGYICIDALDEFPSKHRAELWRSIQQAFAKSPNCRLFLTGRPQIVTEAANYFPEIARMIIIKPALDDIGRYIEKRLEEDIDLDAMDAELRADILRVVPERISGIFLLVSMNMDAILAEATIHQRRQALHRMTEGLGLQDAYHTTLNRIRRLGGSKSELGMRTLMWISYAKRPLRSEELCHALGVELGAEDINTQNIPSIQAVLNYTLGLVTFDKKESTVRLLHLTLHEYLTKHHTAFTNAHSMMAEICLTYLNSTLIRDLPPNLENVFPKPGFLKYAACFWGTHAAMEVTETLNKLALRLLDGYEGHVSAAVLLEKIGPWGNIWHVHGGISGLHCISYWGIAEIASAMLGSKRWDMNAQDSFGNTPLMWAVIYENERIVQMLLDHGGAVNPNLANMLGETPLSNAAKIGEEACVKLLLEHADINPNLSDGEGMKPLLHAFYEERTGTAKALLECGRVDPNLTDDYGCTPLSIAVEFRNSDLVKLLLERGDVNPNSVDKQGRTPLITAVIKAEDWSLDELYDVVKLLLEFRGVDASLADTDRRTPLSLAAKRGYNEVVGLLLKRADVSPNSRDKKGKTPLLHAIISARWKQECYWDGDPEPDPERDLEALVEILLERTDINPTLSDNKGRTPLSCAIKYGFAGVVHKLLNCIDVDSDSVEKEVHTPLLHSAVKQDRGWDIDPNSADNNGQTPPPFSAESRHGATVKLLLKHTIFNSNSVDKDGRTPISYAAQFGDGAAAKLLLERGDIDPDLPDNDGRTPLSFAAEYGEEGVVELLLECSDVNPDSVDRNGRTPLSFAAKKRHQATVKLLLEHVDVNPNLSDSHGRTPLSFAAEEGHPAVVKLLLEHVNVNPNSPDRNGRTPLSFAARSWCVAIDVVKLLLEHGDINPNLSDSDGRTPLSFAAPNGRPLAVKLLLEHGDTNPDLADSGGRTPLSFAVENGNQAAVKLLLEHSNVNPNSPDSNGRTPLSFAASKGHEGVVKLLLERADVNPDPADSNGRTPLSSGAWGGHAGVVNLLLGRADVNPNSQDHNSQTPLSHAAEAGSESVVKLLLERGDVNPNLLDNNGRTPLFFAAWLGEEGIVKLLLERRDFKPGLLDNFGMTTISIATIWKHYRIVKLLLEYGQPNQPDNNGKTPHNPMPS